MLQPICSDSPSAKSDSYLRRQRQQRFVVCVAELGWREQMISDE